MKVNEVKMDDLLKTAMTSLVKVLREILANMEEEHHSLIMQNASAFQLIMHRRSALMHSMRSYRKTMMTEIDKLQEKYQEFSEAEDEYDKLLNLTQLIGEDNLELLTLRDQILALLDKMEKQNACNNFLLGNRIDGTFEKENYSHQFKPVKRRFLPKKSPSPQKKSLVKTLELAPEERL